MALTPTSIKRAADASGTDIKVFTDSESKEIQGMAVVDTDGDQSGIFDQYKVYNINDPAFLKPRGHMFSVTTRGKNFGGDTIDFNFGGDGASYPNSANGFDDGAQLFPGAQVDSGTNGVYVMPPATKVIYIHSIRCFFNLTDKYLFDNAFLEDAPSPGTVSGLQFHYNGNVFCTRLTPFDISLVSTQSPMEVIDALGNGEYMYSQKFLLECPARLDGDEGNHFGFKTENGTGLYIGSYAANKLSHLYFTFSGWIVTKVDIGGTDYDVIPR